MLYFVQPVDGGPVKIGTTVDLNSRLRQLEAGYRRPLVVLATMEGGPDEEKAMHERFAHIRLGRTEQFRPTAELMAFIGRPLLVSPDPEAVEAIPCLPTGRDALIAIRCREVWKRWLESVAKAERVTPTQLIDKCLAEWAVAHGHKAPPDR